jgi:hypothetical protein
VLNPHLMIGVNELPKAIVLDLSNVRLIDLTGENKRDSSDGVMNVMIGIYVLWILMD